MKLIVRPNRADWPIILERPILDATHLLPIVQGVMEQVQKNGDNALKQYTLQFDKVALERIQLSQEELDASENEIAATLQSAMHVAKNNIEKFHQQQIQKVEKIETMPGVWCWRKLVGIDTVGIYIPGGTAPLFSTVLMLGIPAMIAGCKEVVLCTPPNAAGKIEPTILYAAKLVGIKKVYAVGGVQAIAAMAFGTESVPKVHKIFGPGNQYVTAAKQWVQQYGTAIDMPAGPSEVCVWADDSANPSFVASDLLSQAEHGSDSQVLLIAHDSKMVAAVQEAIEQQLLLLPRKDIAIKALENSTAIVVDSPQDAIELINTYAPEHLILAIENAAVWAEKIVNAGSVFIGHYSPESVGDYASGTNHTLPTNGHARAYSGVSLDSFVKKITFQQLTERGLTNIAQTVVEMASAEGLEAHANAVKVRVEAIQNNK